MSRYIYEDGTGLFFPADVRADTSQPRRFPADRVTDPAVQSGVTVAVGDLWYAAAQGTPPPPPTSGHDTVGVIGDSTVAMNGQGAALISSQLRGMGWAPSNVAVWGIPGLKIAATSGTGAGAPTNTLAMIDSWRAGGFDPRVWVFALGVNDGLASSSSSPFGFDSIRGNAIQSVYDKVMGGTRGDYQIYWIGFDFYATTNSRYSEATTFNNSTLAYFASTYANFHSVSALAWYAPMRKNADWASWWDTAGQINHTDLGYKTVRAPLFARALKAEQPTLTYTRPTGPGYVRYEDLYRSGDTLGAALRRLSGSSPNAFSDGSGYVTFPEGVFTITDLKDFGSTGYGVYVPHNCLGLWGSGPGSLGKTDKGTIFTLAPNSWTHGSPLQSSGQPNPSAMIFRDGGSTVYKNPLWWGQFQLAGTSQGDVDGKCYTNLKIYNPEAPVVVQDVLTTGWFGDNGGPPGETFGVTIHGPNGPHRMYRVVADGRRTAGGPSFGAVGLTFQTTAGGQMHDCYSHHGKASCIVFYEAYDCFSFDCTLGPDSTTGIVANPGFNHERTMGCVHYNPTIHRTVTNKYVHVTHSNDNRTLTMDGVTRTTANGTLAIVNPAWEDIWGDGYFYTQSWTPYMTGDTQTTAPLVVQSDGVTHIPHKWVHSGTHLVS